MAFTNNRVIQLIIDGEERQLGDSINQKNISKYKYQDQQRIFANGGTMASNSEYEQAEAYLQTLYAKWMGV